MKELFRNFNPTPAEVMATAGLALMFIAFVMLASLFDQ